MVVKNIIAEDMPFTKSIFEQFWRSYCKKTIFVVFHFLKFLPKNKNTNNSQGGKNKKNSEVDLDNQVRKLIGIHLSR